MRARELTTVRERTATAKAGAEWVKDQNEPGSQELDLDDVYPWADGASSKG